MLVYNILQQIKNEPSTNAKLEILESHKDNTLLRDCLKLMLDDTCFYINKIPDYNLSNIMPQLPISLADKLDNLSCLSERIYTGGSGIKFLQELLYHSTEEDREVVKLIIKKDPDCGISHKTVNKVWSNLIQETPYMRCETDDSKLVFPCLSQKKADGMFFNAICRNGTVSFLSRNGKPIDLLGVLEKCFDKIADKNIVLHGELLVLDENGQIMNRQTGNGLLQKAVKGTITSDIAERVVCVLWDVVDYDDWRNGYSGVACLTRFNEVEKLVVELCSFRVSLIHHIISYNQEHRQSFYKSMIDKKFEGSVTKNIDGPWEAKTSKNCIKDKEDHDCDLICYDTTPHKKKEGQIGALRCMSSCGKLKVDVTCKNDEMRVLPAEYFIDKIVTVKYNEVIINKKGEHSLFLPRIEELGRVDVNEADNLEKILRGSK